MDRLIEAIEDKQNPSVVGLDPTEALVPKQVVASFAEEIAEQVEDPTEAPAAQLSVAFFEFNRAIIDAVADIVPAVKPQIAMYEQFGVAGPVSREDLFGAGGGLPQQSFLHKVIFAGGTGFVQHQQVKAAL